LLTFSLMPSGAIANYLTGSYMIGPIFKCLHSKDLFL
jgi:hypothetical protein